MQPHTQVLAARVLRRRTSTAEDQQQSGRLVRGRYLLPMLVRQEGASFSHTVTIASFLCSHLAMDKHRRLY